MKTYLSSKCALFDTIGFRIPVGKIRILNPKGFERYDEFKEKKVHRSIFKTDEKQYHPQMSLRRFALNTKGFAPKNYQEALFIQVSAPKLIFGSSISDITCGEQISFVRKIVCWLEKNGVHTTEDFVSSATVYEIHPVFNIWLPSFYDGFDTYDIFEELSRYKLPYFHSRSVVFSEHSGWKIQWHNGKNEVVLYDKRSEIEQSNSFVFPSTISLPVTKNGTPVMEEKTNVVRFEIRFRSGVNIRKKKQNILNEEKTIPAKFTVKDAFETNFCHHIKIQYATRLLKYRKIFRISDHIKKNPDIILSKRKSCNEELRKIVIDLQKKNLSMISSNPNRMETLMNIGESLPPDHTDGWISYLQNEVEADRAVKILNKEFYQ